MNKSYPLVRNQPVARFFYKGTHTHPVRRTVVITESTPNKITGYELREGSQVRALGQAPIKSFSKGRIAKVRQLDKRRKLVSDTLLNGYDLDIPTMQRASLVDLIQKGV